MQGRVDVRPCVVESKRSGKACVKREWGIAILWSMARHLSLCSDEKAGRQGSANVRGCVDATQNDGEMLGKNARNGECPRVKAEGSDMKE